MPEYWELRVENITRKRFFGNREAAETEANRLGRLYLQHPGWRPNVEVVRDTVMEKEFDEDYDELKRGNVGKNRIVQRYSG